jgi:alcohol dehydrogenase class IV
LKATRPLDASAPFRWHDGERVVLFGRGKLAEAASVLDGPYVLLTTGRAASAAGAVVEAATAVHEVEPGRVDEVAGALRSEVRGDLLVALGGGRVIDVAKALAAADPPRKAAAIPTTLSGAEMTAVHRHASGVAAEARRVRPAIVLNDPSLSASQPPSALAQSAANALGHAVEGPLTPLGHPVAAVTAAHAARLIQQGFGGDADEGARDKLALGALLAGYAIGSSGYGLHHILSQTLARFTAVGHAGANAIMLPHTVLALAKRFPDRIAGLGEALGEDAAALAARVRDLGGVERLRDAGVSEEELDRCAEEAAQRPELHMTPPAADRDELRALYAAAY